MTVRSQALPFLLFTSLASPWLGRLDAQTTLTAQPSLNPVLMTDGNGFDADFELGLGETDPPSQSYGMWTFGTGTGIQHDSDAPSGDNLATLTGTGSFEVTTHFAAGTYRLVYEMAHDGVPATEHFVKIQVGNKVIAEDEFITDTFGSFVSRPFFLRVPGFRTVRFTGVGDATATSRMDNVRIEPLRAWSDATTWLPPQVPTDQDTVNIPGSSVIALYGDQEAHEVFVDGELVAANRHGSLEAELVMVDGDGARFEVGRRRAPFLEDFTLVLTGDYEDTSCSTGAAHKALIARDDAEVDFHGAPKTSWTRLTPTAVWPPAYITVEDPSGWEVGDLIVITGSQGQSAFTGYVDETEVRSISSIAQGPGPGGIVETRIFLGDPSDPLVGMPLNKVHENSSILTRTVNGQVLTLDQRAEVGVLTRNVVIRGGPTDALTAPAYGPDAGFGGHIMISGAVLDHEAVGRFSGVELTQMGQSRIVGRYPFHWHVCRDKGAGQYIVESSIHDTFNRAVTVHGTDEALVADNVMYDNLGHALFLEDGSEMDNQILRNLVVSTKRPALADVTIPSDNMFNDFQNRTPASYWITNPNNTIEDNVASDTIGTGFWFILPREVHGLSAASPGGHNATVEPYKQTVGSFARNVAHGCSAGLDLNDSLAGPEGPPCLPTGGGLIRPANPSWEPPSQQELEDMTIYACGSGVYSSQGPGRTTLLRARMADNEDHLWLASSDEVRDSLVLADSGNGLEPMGVDLNGYTLYDGPARIVDSRMEGFSGVNRNLLAHVSAADRHPGHVFENVTLVQAAADPDIEWLDFGAHFGGNTDNCPPNPASVGDLGIAADIEVCGLIVHDKTGDLSGFVDHSLIPDVEILKNSQLVLDGLGNPELAGPNTFVTSAHYGLARLHAPAHSLNFNFFPEVKFERVGTGGVEATYCARVKGNVNGIVRFQQIPTILGNSYRYDLTVDVSQMPGGKLATSPNKAEMELQFLDMHAGVETYVAVVNMDEITGGASLGIVRYNGAALMEAASLSALEDPMNTSTGYFYDEQPSPGPSILYVRCFQENGIMSNGEIALNNTDILSFNWN